MDKINEPLISSTEPINYVHTLHEALKHRGEDVSYAYVMGVSGEAFRFLYNRSDPEAGMKTFFQNPLRAACRSLGYKHEVAHDESYQSASERLEENIRTGKPALIPFGDSCPFVSEHETPGRLVCQNGYRYELSTADLHTKWEPHHGFLELGPKGYYQFIIGDREREPKPRETALGALRGAKKMMRARQKVQGCAMGLAAYYEFISQLQGMLSRRKPLTPHDVARIAQWNGRPISQAISTRQLTVEYLELVRENFEKEELEHLDRAIALYRKIGALLCRLRAVLPSADTSPNTKLPSDERSKARVSISRLFRIQAPMFVQRQPASGRTVVKEFKPKCRLAIKVLLRIVQAETKAISEIEKILQLSEKMKM
ncbi:MAG: hypothetical protein OXT74_18545 [Candidatus Poribacteria bacterium]|nr:hypothetical protein [Candidatus Poribacteria bacterium]